MSHSQNWRPGETFFSPMGSGVGAVVPGPAAAPTPPPPPPVSNAAGTPRKLVAQELYWRWFQMADKGARRQRGGAESPQRAAALRLPLYLAL